MAKQPTHAMIISTSADDVYIACYYLSPNLGRCHTDYVYVSKDNIHVGLCNQRYVTIGGRELPISI